MKTKISSVCTLLLLASSVWLQAETSGTATKPASASAGDAAKTSSPEFERMKTLVGSWTGKCDMGQGPIDMTVQYRLLASGSVLEERVFAGTPNEMVTMFYDQNGKLALTRSVNVLIARREPEPQSPSTSPW